MSNFFKQPAQRKTIEFRFTIPTLKKFVLLLPSEIILQADLQDHQDVNLSIPAIS